MNEWIFSHKRIYFGWYISEQISELALLQWTWVISEIIMYLSQKLIKNILIARIFEN